MKTIINQQNQLLSQTKYCRPETFSKAQEEQLEQERKLERVNTDEYFVESNYKLKHGNQPHITSAKKSDGRNSSLGCSPLNHNPLFSMRETLNQSNSLALRSLYSNTPANPTANPIAGHTALTSPHLAPTGVYSYKHFTSNEYCLQLLETGPVKSKNQDKTQNKPKQLKRPKIPAEITPIRPRSGMEDGVIEYLDDVVWDRSGKKEK